MNIRINKNDIESALDVILVILTVVGLIGLVFFEAFVLMKCFNWFVVPLMGWTDREPIGYWLTFGISLTLTLIKGFKDNNSNDTDYSNTSCASAFGTVLAYYVVIALFLGVGALVHLGV